MIEILKMIDELLLKLEAKKDWYSVTELGKIREKLINLQVEKDVGGA